MNDKIYRRIWTAAAWVVIVFMLAPLVVIVLGSFTAEEFLSLPFELSLRWYADIINHPRFLDGFINSLELGVAAALLATLLGVSAATALARRQIPASGAIALLLLLPIMIPSVITAMALLQFFNNLHVTSPYATLLVGHTIITLPYVVRTVTASLHVMPRGLEWAGANLGANPWRVIWHVVLPNILPGLIGGLIFAFVVSFDTVTVSIFLLKPSFIPLPVRLYDFIQTGVSPVLAAVSTLLILFTAAAVYIAERIAGLAVLFGGER
jgi:putative spermidine/putrescine transport system permease protein